LITTTDWLTQLDGKYGDRCYGSDCALNTNLFKDPAGYLKSLPTSDWPPTVFEGLRDTAAKLVSAQRVTEGDEIA
jgi:hypothetical protein